MAEVIWTHNALADLDAIAGYIAISHPPAAQQLVNTLFSVVERLAQFPLSGRKPPELEHLDYREVVHPPCRLFYKIEQDKVFVLHIMRQEQELRRFLLEAGPDA